MKRRALLVAAGTGALLWPWSSQAQNPGTVRRLGILSTEFLDRTILDTTLFQALRQLGWTEGNNLAVHYRPAQGRDERMPELALELVQQKVDVIYTVGSPFTLEAARKATSTIPIVFTGGYSDNVLAGMIQSLARPGGNITGATFSSGELPGKRLQLLKEIVPRLSRVGFLSEQKLLGVPGAQQELSSDAARLLGIKILTFIARNSIEFEDMVKKATKSKVGALAVPGTPLYANQKNSTLLAQLLLKYRIPSIASWPYMANTGILMAYGPRADELISRAAVYIDKIFRGANPADLPVEEPTRYYLAINLKTAKALKIRIPQALLARADRVIE